MSPVVSDKARNHAIPALLAVTLVVAGCKKPPAEAPDAVAQAPSAAAAPAVEGQLKDVMETDPRYIVGISYPPAAAKYPGLATELKRYAETTRQDLMKALDTTAQAKPAMPYDLTLNFTMLAETATVVAVAGDGSLYTGGAHGAPLVARFVWLPQQGRMMRSTDLLADASGWRAVSDYVREQLHATLSQRIDADELPAEQRAQLMQTIGTMIDDGTEPVAASFSTFEPVLAPDGGRLIALRFVFPPYQVGPYVDGNRSVEVPVTVLRPWLAPTYRDLFEAG